MSSYEESMRAKFRGEDIYTENECSTISENIDENIDEDTYLEIAENENIETETEDVETVNAEYEDFAPQTYRPANAGSSANKTGIDINKVSELKGFLVSDDMFDLFGAFAGLVAMLIAISKMVYYGYEQSFLTFLLLGLGVLLFFVIKNRLKKNKTNKDLRKLKNGQRY